MLKKTFRLSNSKDIQTTSLRGRTFFSPYFVIKYAARADANPRFTVIASTRVSKRAVERNRLKRIIREVVRQALSNFKTGDYIIIVKARASGKPAAEIREKLDQLLTSVKLKSKS